MSIKKRWYREFPGGSARLRIWHCHYCGEGFILDLTNSSWHGWGQKKKKVVYAVQVLNWNPFSNPSSPTHICRATLRTEQQGTPLSLGICTQHWPSRTHYPKHPIWWSRPFRETLLDLDLCPQYRRQLCQKTWVQCQSQSRDGPCWWFWDDLSSLST